MKQTIEVGNRVEIIDCDEMFPHEFLIGYRYDVQRIEIIGDKEQTRLYILKDFNFSTHKWFEAGVFESEIKLVNKE